MERPVAGSRIGGCLEPAARREDVVALVAVDVAGADAVPVGRGADDVRDPGLVLDLVPRLPGTVLLGDDLVGLAVVVHVGEGRELDVESFVNRRQLPIAAGLSRIPPPRHALREPRDRRDVGIVVAVDIDYEVAEVVDVLIAESQLAEAVRYPFLGDVECGGLVPVLAGDDVEPAVAVDVGYCRGLAGAAVDCVHPEGDVRRAASLHCEEQQE